MSILFVLLMFLLIFSISYFRRMGEQPRLEERTPARPQAPRVKQEYGFEVPQGFAFHPGHSWAAKEAPENARIGIDNFAGMLLGKIDHIEVAGQNRWIRQGQKIASLRAGETTVEVVSPIEGVITNINRDVVEDPSLLTRSPYKDGWIATIKSPDLAINQKNLVQEAMVAPWMQNNVTRLNQMLGQLSPALAQDGGLPVSGVLRRVAPELREQLVKEFFLS
jgi:glycine cleavage system H lipoate-binding protein